MTSEEKSLFKLSDVGTIPKDWEVSTIEDVTSRVCVGFVGTCFKDYCDQEHGVPMIRTTNLSESGIVYTDLKYVTKEFHRNNKKSQLVKGDIVVARHGDSGKACYYDADFESNCLNIIVIRTDKDKCDPKFLLYSFRNPKVKRQIDASIVGSVQGVLNTKILAKLLLPLPKLEEQICIGTILSNIDSRIVFNQEMNKVLEAIGQALFEHWFVDFDFPNQEGKPYKTTGGKMQYNKDLQMEIPENWTAKRIGDLAKINERSVNRDFIFSEIEYVDIDSVEQGIVKKRQILSVNNAPSRAKRIVKDEDIIISTVRPNLKHFAFIQGAKPNTIVSTGFAVISAKSTSAKLLYYYLTRDKYTDYLSAIADSHTSTYPSFNPDIIYNTLIPHPAEEKQAEIPKLLRDFDLLLSCMFSKIHNNNEQNSVLSQLRDNLLPKLMSGKIRVPINREN